MKNIVIFGAGGLGREAAIMIGSINEKNPSKYNLLGFVVDSCYFKENTYINGVPLIGDFEWLLKNKENVSCVIALGNSIARKETFCRLKEHGVRIETIISPEVYVDPSCYVGEGSYVGYRVVLSVNSHFGKGTFINTDTIIGHDTNCGEFVSIGPRVSIGGNCIIENLTEIGGGAYIVPKRKIGENSKIAAGSVVFSHVKKNTHVLGNPARKIEL